MMVELKLQGELEGDGEGGEKGRERVPRAKVCCLSHPSPTLLAHKARQENKRAKIKMRRRVSK